MHKWFQFPIIEGLSSKQAHCDLPDGSFERECGRDGFFGPATHMYHKHPPTSWVSWCGEHKPRAFDALALPQVGDTPWDAPLLLSNGDIKLRIWQTNKSMDHLVRNGDGDELLFVHQGSGDLYCDYGHLPFNEGDYLVLPRSTTWRIETANTVALLMIEATNNSFKSVDHGIVGQHAVFDPAILEYPKINAAFKAQQTEDNWQVFLKARNQINTISYPFNPLDSIGWKGNLTVLKLNWRDIRPLMSHRYHLPPSAHSTFVSDNFIVCTFVPRPVESDPNALKVPFFHSNNDYDEVIFYHHGDFFSRDNIKPGMITFHPNGFPHGPHPNALTLSQQAPKTFIDEVAVMIDTRNPLDIAPNISEVELHNYVASWQRHEDPEKQ
ncbi:homogentisate 1,2-dioxygenase [Photobacterium angustum]|uniref:homogentisate 1,2-dioxygenase n=1 Tax=Photobacterium angustum TaxID=661 RepID=UPI0005DCAF4D|nr:homogentisate 1,2-dioxygenase [Photobacterium angustum]KJG03056.1 dioxygenase [Photobacterium angustum]PSV65102.1 homogentisate 1,2-dioxygenase [Photobacterium angustum]